MPQKLLLSYEACLADQRAFAGPASAPNAAATESNAGGGQMTIAEMMAKTAMEEDET